MSGTAASFLGFAASVALAIVAIAAWRLAAGTARRIAAGLFLWLAYVGILSWLGLVSNPAIRPPAILFIVGPVILFMVFGMARSRSAGLIALAIPLWVLIGFQMFRIGVELFLHQLWREGIVPKMLTFDGANVDIWIGASAPLAAWLATRGRGGRGIAAIWNVAGLFALANVIVRSALTSPGPFNLIDAEVVNRAIGAFPYTYIAGFLAPLAIALHILALRALAHSSVRSAQPAGSNSSSSGIAA